MGFWILNIQAVVVVFHLICGLQQSSCLFVSPLHPTPTYLPLQYLFQFILVSQIGFSTSGMANNLLSCNTGLSSSIPWFTQVLLPTILQIFQFSFSERFYRAGRNLLVSSSCQSPLSGSKTVVVHHPRLMPKASLITQPSIWTLQSCSSLINFQIHSLT